MIPSQEGRLYIGPVGTPDDELTEVGAYRARDLDRVLGGGTIVSHGPKRELRGRIAFRYPAAGLTPEQVIGAHVESLTHHGVNLARPGHVVVAAEPIDGGDLWIIAERWEDA